MTHDEFISVLQERLGKRTDLSSATMLIEANMIRTTILEKATFNPWFLQSEDTTISTVAGTEYVSLPTGFLAFDPEDEWSGVAYKDTSISTPDQYVPIPLDDFNVIKAYYKDSVSGKPKKGGLIGSKVYFRPIPDAIYPLRFRFYITDSAFSTGNGTNLWLTNATDWALGEVGFVLASQYVKDTECAGIFDTIRKEGRRRVYLETVKRQEAGKSRSMGDE